MTNIDEKKKVALSEYLLDRFFEAKRKNRRLSQASWAESLGLTGAAINQYINMHRWPDPAALVKLGMVFGVEFLRAVNLEDEIDITILALAEICKGLSPERKMELLKIALEFYNRYKM